MKINDLYDAVAGIDDDLIERADAARRGGNASAVRTASAHNTINTGRLTGIAASVIAAVCALANSPYRDCTIGSHFHLPLE